MKQMSFVCLYFSYLEDFQGLSDAAMGKLVRAMLRYTITGEETKLTGDAKTVWPMVRGQLERDMERYQKRCETNRVNGAKGGRPRKNQTLFPETEAYIEKLKKAKENEKEKENENENENAKDKENETPTHGFSRGCERPGSFHELAGDDYETEDWDPFVSPFGTPRYHRADS